MFKANNGLSLHRFTLFIRESMTPEIAAKIVLAGLMLIQQSGDGVRIMSLINDISPDIREHALTIFFALDVANYDICVESMIVHIYDGHDTEDSDSIGGFSQREIDLIMSFFGGI